MLILEPSVVKRKRRTAEMTWGETPNTQLRFHGQANKQSRCFALTSIDLFDAALFSKVFSPNRTFVCYQVAS